MKKLLIVALLSIAVTAVAQQAYQSKIARIETSSNGADWGAIPGLEKGQIIFSSDGLISEKDALGDIVTRLYVLNNDPAAQPRLLFSEEEFKEDYLGSPCLSADGKWLFFTISGEVGTKINSDFFLGGQVLYPTQIWYRERNNEGAWGTPVSFAHNDTRFSTGDPWFSPDGKYLYFSSNRPGGFGGADVYRSKQNGDGTWGEPENLGEEINTDGEERFPRFDKEGNFYFSSDYSSQGGLDLFTCSRANDDRLTTPIRMSAPFNSKEDDFAIVFIDDHTGYLSSNREGKDAIYYFEQPVPVEVKTTVKVQDTDGNLIEGARVAFINAQTGDAKTVGTNAAGEATVVLNTQLPYDAVASKTGYIPTTYEKRLPADYDKMVIKLAKEQSATPDKEALPFTDLFVPVQLSGILFDFDKWNIRDDAVVEINRLVVFMQKYPTVEIELSAHTDCIGSEAYNQHLSEQRALSVKNYMVGKGIAAARMQTKGYAAKQPVNNCTCQENHPCTPEERAVNRRVEYKILKHSEK
jgi:outer membrane protein OmpA-like peptidoglycan-associated protein/Tol biopolymer transport system component